MRYVVGRCLVVLNEFYASFCPDSVFSFVVLSDLFDREVLGILI